MAAPSINTFQEVVPYVYSWMTPDIPKYAGWEKIGYTEQAGGPDARIAQQASQLSVEKKKLWALRAYFQTERGGRFTDKDFHAYLKHQGVQREYNPHSQPKRTEWHYFADTPRTSKEYFLEFASQEPSDIQRFGTEDYELRPEQHAAVTQALTAFDAGHDEILWNAKPRFGKTLTTYDLMRKLDALKVLVVTNRPAIANSWFDDFNRFIGHQTDYVFVSESSSLSDRATMSREEWTRHAISSENPRIVEFLSLQDLKGSHYFGGQFNKLKHIAEFNWDLLVIDEAHEGINTSKADVAFENITRKRTLHLSGTPFKALASGKFNQEQIYNWTYQDEQTARDDWSDETQDNPYSALPTLNMFTYQISRMITNRLAEGVALAEDKANIDYAFNLNEFFATRENGTFEHREDIIKFLDCLVKNEKYPFSTPELRQEIRHSFWLLDRVASAKALERLLNQHEVFQEYTIILAAGDGRNQDSNDSIASEKSLTRVRKAIADAEATGGKTITLSVGQLTTGVTIPEWTAVLMLSNLTSPALYMQAAFRAQNPHTFMHGNSMLQKKNAYIFDFAPERTLTIIDEFANNLNSRSSESPEARRENIRELLNFFPVIGEDSDGKMVALDADQVLTIPQLFKAKEVVRRGFLSNLLFDNVAGIFRYTEHVRKILEKLPEAKEGTITRGSGIEFTEPAPSTDRDGNVQVDFDTVVNPKVEQLGKPVWGKEQIANVNFNSTPGKLAKELASLVTERTKGTRAKLKEEYGFTASQSDRDVKRTESKIESAVDRAFTNMQINEKHISDQLEAASTDEEISAVIELKTETEENFRSEILTILEKNSSAIVPEIVTREETKREQKRANATIDDARSHLRGFARTIPLFLMAYGHADMCLANFELHTPREIFEDITGISIEEFQILRDGQQAVDESGESVQLPGFFNEAVFDQAIQEFLIKKSSLSNYFDSSLTENIFAYIPRQESWLVFTPQPVVERMVDQLEKSNPGIFEDPEKTFLDPFSTAGLFIMELVRRLDAGLSKKIPDQQLRLKHILSNQVYEMSHNQILHDITVEAISGGVEERKLWMLHSGHYKVANVAEMTSEELASLACNLLPEGIKDV